MKKLSIFAFIGLLSAALIMFGCGRDGGGNLPPDDDDPPDHSTIDPETIDTDGDGCPDYRDYDPFNSEIGCTKPPDINNDIKPECLDDGQWVSLSNKDSLLDILQNDGELIDCINEKEFDKEIIVKVRLCIDHKDALVINRSLLSVTSFGDFTPDVGAFSGLYRGGSGPCPEDLLDRAEVTVINSGKALQFDWLHPAFTPFNLNLQDMDEAAATQINVKGEDLGVDGRSEVKYSSANNGWGLGNNFHIFVVRDVYDGPGANPYSIKFRYRYSIKELGYYE